MRQRPLDAGVLVIFPVLLLGLAPGAADDGGAVVENQDVLWIAPVRRGAAADVGDDVTGDPRVRPKDEDALGVRCGELAAAGGRASLVQNRRPLRRRLGQVDGVHLIAGPVMPHAVDLRGSAKMRLGLSRRTAPSSQLASHSW